MSYRLLQFNLGTDYAQGYVLQGQGEHEGTNETISVSDMQAFAKDGATLARYLDYRFLRAHGERVKRDMDAQTDPNMLGQRDG